MASIRSMVDRYCLLHRGPGTGTARPCCSTAARGERNRSLLKTGGVMMLLWLLAGAAVAQTPAAGPPVANRWLLVVDTSLAMKPRAASVPHVAAALVLSGMNGQMRRGDTLGLWTFNEELYAGTFPLQRWTPSTSREVATRLFDFLQAQPYEKTSRMDRIVPDLKEIIAASEYITVILITDGQKEIRGTPFDKEINEIFWKWRAEQERTLVPFVTALRAQQGQITNYAVSVPPWPLELPPLPAALMTVQAPESDAHQPPAPPKAQPLILRGKKPEIAPDSAASNPPPPVAAATGLDAHSSLASAPPSATAATQGISPPAPAEITGGENRSPTEPQTRLAAEASQPMPEGTTPGAADSRRAVAPPKIRPADSAAAARTAGVEGSTPGTSARPEPEAARNYRWILGLGCVAVVLGGVAVGIALWMMRRLRAPTRVSLVNRAMDQGRK